MWELHLLLHSGEECNPFIAKRDLILVGLIPSQLLYLTSCEMTLQWGFVMVGSLYIR